MINQFLLKHNACLSGCPDDVILISDVDRDKLPMISLREWSVNPLTPETFVAVIFQETASGSHRQSPRITLPF